jgi:putative FmdB family regulatory protein
MGIVSSTRAVTLPIYEYRCTECGNHFEVSQRMSDAPLVRCEVCQGQLTKVLFAPAIHFKGTGFHNTDYGTRRRDEGADSGGESGGTGGDAKGGDAKGGGEPAPKKEAPSGSGKTVGLDKV